jgi:hypothetical protein
MTSAEPPARDRPRALDRPQVTVVIPVWGDFIEPARRAVASVLADRTPARILIVDNAHQPPLGGFSGCEVVRSDVRLSRGASRNLGLEAVESPYVMFLDADDVLLPDGLERLVRGLDANPGADALIGRIRERGGDLHRLPRSFCGRLSRLPRLLAWTHAVWPVISIQGCAVLRTEAVRLAGGYCDVSTGEEWALGTILGFRGRLAFTQVPVLSYDIGPDSPGIARVSATSLLASAARLRRRLREGRLPGVNFVGLTLLAAVHTAVILGIRPVVRRYLRPQMKRRRPAGRAPDPLVKARAGCESGDPADRVATVPGRSGGYF